MCGGEKKEVAVVTNTFRELSRSSHEWHIGYLYNNRGWCKGQRLFGLRACCGW